MINPTDEVRHIVDTASETLSDGAPDLSGALDAVVEVATDFAKSAAVAAAVPGVSMPGLISRMVSIFKRHPKILVFTLLVGAGVVWKRSSSEDQS